MIVVNLEYPEWSLEPRRSKIFYIDCHAPEDFFEEDWDKLNQSSKNWFRDSRNFLPCEGSGAIGLYCERCSWSNIDEE